MTHALAIDANIRDWVLLPIVFVMFLFGVLRHYVAIMLRSTPRPPEKDKIRQAQTLIRSKQLHDNAHYLPAASFNVRKQAFTSKEGGLLHEKIESSTLTSMTDPTNMVEMMKGNLATLIPNVAMLGWVSYLYSGFVVAKFPFPLTSRFRSMLQRGIELNSLEISYVTSMSMYFLILFGLRGLFSLVLGEENAADDAQMMQQQTQMMSGGLMGAPGQVDMNKAFEAERENLEMVQHNFKLKDAEDVLLAKLKAKK